MGKLVADDQSDYSRDRFCLLPYTFPQQNIVCNHTYHKLADLLETASHSAGSRDPGWMESAADRDSAAMVLVAYKGPAGKLADMAPGNTWAGCHSEGGHSDLKAPAYLDSWNGRDFWIYHSWSFFCADHTGTLYSVFENEPVGEAPVLGWLQPQ